MVWGSDWDAQGLGGRGMMLQRLNAMMASHFLQGNLEAAQIIVDLRVEEYEIFG